MLRGLALIKFTVCTVILALLCWLRWSVEWHWMTGKGGLVVIVAYGILHLLGTLFNILVLFWLNESNQDGRAAT